MTDERREITVTVHEWEDDFNVPAQEFLNDVARRILDVPEQFRSSLMLDFDRRGSDYDYSAGEMSLYYVRPETDDEFRTRKQYEARRVSESEAKERSIYEALKKKYGG